MKAQNIIKKAHTLYKAMEIKIKGEEANDTVIAIIKEGKHHQELLDLTFKVSEETSLSINSVYMFVYEALQTILNVENATKIDEIIEAIGETEADAYTGELTAWLAENVHHV